MTAKEMLNKRKFNTDEPISLSESDVKDLMNEFALHIAEEAVQDEKNEYLSDTGDNVCDRILSRIKQLTEQK